MEYRHEWKYEIDPLDLFVLRMRLSAVMQSDPHTVNGKYAVRSLYFDNASDQALRQKIEGINEREKFRVRFYNGDISFIQLEKKSKRNGLGNKQSVRITEKETQALVNGELDWMPRHAHGLVKEMYWKIKVNGLRPKTIVDYIREPFIYKPGNVRITFDYDIRTGLNYTDFLSSRCVMIPAGNAPILLEVKWDRFFPGLIRDLIYLPGRNVGAFSKYAQCRVYG